MELLITVLALIAAIYALVPRARQLDLQLRIGLFDWIALQGRLSRPWGSSSSYFTQNEFTPGGKWMVFRSDMDGTTHVYDVEIPRAE